MLGKQDRNEKMFYYVKIDDLIPEDHLLKLVAPAGRSWLCSKEDEAPLQSYGPPLISTREVLLKDPVVGDPLRHHLRERLLF